MEMRSIESSAALQRLIRIARSNTGQSRIVAGFLLAWWNAEECGGFDLTDLWGVDTSIAADMLRVFALLAECQQYPDTLGYGKDFEANRPRVAAGADRRLLICADGSVRLVPANGRRRSQPLAKAPFPS
jgi:hypothetical protein